MTASPAPAAARAVNDDADPTRPARRASLPLARLLGHAADAVQAVRAGRSLDAALAGCPADARPGTQALAFHAMRGLGGAQAARARLAPKAPPPAVDALLLTALALLWVDDSAAGSTDDTAAPRRAAPPADASADTLPYAAHTLVDQAVTAARQRRAGATAAKDAAFTNAVLRRFVRDRATLVEQLCRDDPMARHNHPAWWTEQLRRDWPAHWQALLQANQRHPPMTLRVNARRTDVAGYLRRLADAGIAAQAGDAAGAPQAIVLARPCPVGRLPGFADGDVSVQDAAAQRAAPLLLGRTGSAGNAAGGPGGVDSGHDPAAHAAHAAALPLRPGARVLDACAAPGGKTAHLLELADLDLLAIDSDAERLTRVHDTLARLRLSARTLAADAANPTAWWDGRPFDAILLDAPCSASGIVRRHPDVRWLRRASDVDRLARSQARLLDALWPTLAPGGRLLYCTCSVFKAEGRQVIDAFLQRQRDARPAIEPPSPGHLLPLADNQHTATDRAADGFFYALLEKH